MSRRPNPATDRVEQNRATLKSLVKLESNKTCADCKKNKHPRWASWNLGIFICIRCSGIHRGMGTHISRVKSVDLDSWTDEQTQNMLKWGNARANKYWESKLAPGHVPADAKIENFIRTKYDSKRWVMDGGMPDPSTLGTDGDDDVPLNVVQEKAKMARSASQRASTSQTIPPPSRPQQNIDLFGDDEPISAPARPNTTGPVSRNPPPKATPAPPKQTKPGDSLLGLDFFGSSSMEPPARPASTSNAAPSTANVPSRPDLKQSILSLYASAPKPATPSQSSHSQQGSFAGLTSPGSQSTSPKAQQGNFGDFNDAFSSLSFGSPQQQQPPAQQKPAPFSNLSGLTSPGHKPQSSTTSAFGSGGNFFNPPKPTPPTSPPVQSPRQAQRSTSNDFGDFTSFTSPEPTPASNPPPSKPAAPATGDLFDLSIPPSQPSQPTAPPQQSPQPQINSAFNLSSAPTTQPASQSQPQTQASPAPPAINYAGFSNMDAWGSSDAWSSPAPADNSASKPAQPSPQPTSASGADFGWGAPSPPKPAAPEPKITADEDFGGWTSSVPDNSSSNAAPSQPPKPVGGFGGGDDLFSNVWE